tara:strand:- start:1028 stop:1537 length:510 start_codon:yes stop_codon:yes gene_type:complete
MIDIEEQTLSLIKKNKSWSQDVLDYYGEELYAVLYLLFSKNKKQILSKKRTAELTLCRKAFCTILCFDHDLHPTVVAKFINRDRTSILYYLNNHEGDYEYYKEYKEAYDVLSAHISQILDKDNIMNFYDEKTKELKQIEIIKNRVNELSKENTKLKEQLNNLKTIINYG